MFESFTFSENNLIFFPFHNIFLNFKKSSFRDVWQFCHAIIWLFLWQSQAWFSLFPTRQSGWPMEKPQCLELTPKIRSKLIQTLTNLDQQESKYFLKLSNNVFSFFSQIGSYINTTKISVPPSALVATPDINVYFVAAETIFSDADVLAVKVCF